MMSEIKTVGELIEYLQTLPLDAKVFVSHNFIDPLGNSCFDHPEPNYDEYLNQVIL